MSSWFAKVFEKKKEEAASTTPAAAVAERPGAEPPAVERLPRERRVVHAPVLHEESSAAPHTGVRIKAQLDPSGEKITLMADRPVLRGYSFHCASRGEAAGRSPLAETLFALGGVASVQIIESNVTITRDGTGQVSAEDFARQAGAVLRTHLESGATALAADYLAAMPGEDEIRAALQSVIDDQINPGIAAHSGNIILNRIHGNTAYITMGGGCQGCAASSITLRSGVEQAFRQAMPHLGALLDETDHAAGANPFFTELPVGMGG